MSNDIVDAIHKISLLEIELMNAYQAASDIASELNRHKYPSSLSLMFERMPKLVLWTAFKDRLPTRDDAGEYFEIYIYSHEFKNVGSYPLDVALLLFEDYPDLQWFPVPKKPRPPLTAVEVLNQSRITVDVSDLRPDELSRYKAELEKAGIRELDKLSIFDSKFIFK